MLPETVPAESSTEIPRAAESRDISFTRVLMIHLSIVGQRGRGTRSLQRPPLGGPRRAPFERLGGRSARDLQDFVPRISSRDRVSSRHSWSSFNERRGI